MSECASKSIHVFVATQKTLPTSTSWVEKQFHSLKQSKLAISVISYS